MDHGKIEIYHMMNGEHPLIRLQDTFKDIYETSGYTDIHVSISHYKDYTVGTKL